MEKFVLRLFFTICFLFYSLLVLNAQSLSGHWKGPLFVSGGKLHLILNIEEQKDGLKATLDSPDQGAYGLKVDSLVQKGDSLYFYLHSIGALYKAKYLKQEEQIQGQWQQQNTSLPLKLQKTADATHSLRPQTPEPPYPYHSEEVSFENKEAGIRLAGTFTRPKAEGQYPAVVLISGSGPQDRDASIFGHKPFLLLADQLSRQGLAVLRYDDRGFGKSSGNFTEATSKDFASDAAAAVSYLQYRPDVEAGQIGLLGHSEGGIIAPLVAQTAQPVQFMVLLAAPVLPGHELLMLQGKEMMERQGASRQELQNYQDTQGAILEVLRSGREKEEAVKELQNILKTTYDSLLSGEQQDYSAQINAQVAQLLSPWFLFYANYDPAPSFARLKVPTLALYAGKDVQVPAEENAAALKKIISEEQKDNIEVRIMEGLNHLFQPAETGLPIEYNQTSTTMAPMVPEEIANWILKQLPSPTE